MWLGEPPCRGSAEVNLGPLFFKRNEKTTFTLHKSQQSQGSNGPSPGKNHLSDQGLRSWKTLVMKLKTTLATNGTQSESEAYNEEWQQYVRRKNET